MSDTERPADQSRAVDEDAWEQACAEDLAAEQARRRAQYGTPPGSAADELRRLVDAVSEKLSGLQSPIAGVVSQGAVNQLINQAKSVVEPVIQRNPDVFDHLAAAGSELLAAYRSAVEGHERRWTEDDDRRSRQPRPGQDEDRGKREDPDRTGGGNEKDARKDREDRKDEGPWGGDHIDLD